MPTKRLLRPAVASAAAAITLAACTAGTAETSGAAGPATGRNAPAPGRSLPNLTDVKRDIVAYHDSGAWDREIAAADGSGRRYLEQRLRQGVDKPAIVLDVDDTSLETYSFRAPRDFGFDREQWNAHAAGKKLGVIKSTLALAEYAAARKVAVFFVTGRRDSPRMRAGTLGNLTEQGYPKPARLYLRPKDDRNASVVPYKSGVRASLEKRGYDIVLNVGDQWSDLKGGHADRAVKLPNPMYTLP